MDKESFDFVVYMLHACANRWHKTPSDIYKLLHNSGCNDNYLVPHYGVLHTLGTEYIVEDVKEYLAIRGINI